MDWAAHQSDWPMAAASRFTLCKPHRWHVQEMGDGPTLLLIHGAGGGTQSWRHLMPLLAADARVIAMDLPGQGFTKSGSRQRHGLVPTAQDIAALCAQEGWQPQAIIGHSAGAAIALELAPMLQGRPAIVGINAALSTFKGLAGLAFPVIAKTLSVLPGVAQLFTASTTRKGSVARLIEGTGSHLPEAELKWYSALISDRDHVDGALSMMAAWDLNPLLRKLPDHASDVLLIAADGDKTVPPQTSADAALALPRGQSVLLEGLGHLAHEEDAQAVLTPIRAFLNERAIL
jgi:magnesium chelatase accessory protein